MTVWLFYDFVATGEPKINCPVVQIVKPLAKGPSKIDYFMFVYKHSKTCILRHVWPQGPCKYTSEI